MGHVSLWPEFLSPPIGQGAAQDVRRKRNPATVCVGDRKKVVLAGSKSCFGGVMQDLLWIGITVTFFGLSIAYVHFCERLK
jgi:hypothetical protein